MNSHLVRFALVLGVSMVAGCKDEPAAPTEKPQSRLEILPASVPQLRLGDTIRLSARRLDAAGAPLVNDVPRLIWESTDTTVLMVDGDGFTQVVGLGNAAIRVRVADADSLMVPSTRDTASATIALVASPTVFHPGPLIAAATEARHQCIVLVGGQAQCRGNNFSGQVGTGATSAFSDSITSWTPVVGGLAFSSISTAITTTCALGAGNRAYCWGANNRGQFGSGRTIPTTSGAPVEVGGGHRWLSIQSRGHAQTCGITTSNVALCVGHNDWGQVGREPKVSEDTVLGEFGTGQVMSMIVTDDFMTCGLRTDGQVVCSGWSGAPTNTPSGPAHGVPSPIGGGALTSVAVGYAHGCGLNSAGAAYCWGENESGQLGTSDFIGSGSARPVVGGHTFARIYVFDWTSCGVTTAGETWCWGLNRGRALGRTRLGLSSAPIRVAIGLNARFINRLSQGTIGTCAVDDSDRLVCWGGRF